MKKWNIEKLVIATFLFLFSTLAAAPSPSEATTVQETAHMTQVAFAKAAVRAPSVRLHAPKVAKLDNLGDNQVKGSRIFIRSVDEMDIVTTALMQLPMLFDNSKISSKAEDYDSADGAYVSLGPTHLLIGLLKADGLNPGVTHRLEAVLSSPESYGLDANAINVSLSPKLIEVATVNINNQMSKFHLLAMDMPPPDKHEGKGALAPLLNKIYSTFKGYTDIMSKRAPGKPIEIHTRLTLGSNQSTQKIFITLQMIAAQLAGVDHLIIHHADTATETLQEAQHFLQAHQGESIDQVLDQLE